MPMKLSELQEISGSPLDRDRNLTAGMATTAIALAGMQQSLQTMAMPNMTAIAAIAAMSKMAMSNTTAMALAGMHQSLETMSAQEAQRNRATSAVLLRASGERMRAESEARQATIDIRELTTRNSKTLQQVQEASVAADVTARHYFLWGILITALFAFVGWVVATPNAGQVLLNLLHH